MFAALFIHLEKLLFHPNLLTLGDDSVSFFLFQTFSQHCCSQEQFLSLPSSPSAIWASLQSEPTSWCSYLGPHYTRIIPWTYLKLYFVPNEIFQKLLQGFRFPMFPTLASREKQARSRRLFDLWVRQLGVGRKQEPLYLQCDTQWLPF